MLTTHVDADVSTADAGELGGAAWTLGVAHPTGFPLDMLALLPLGSLAFRQSSGRTRTRWSARPSCRRSTSSPLCVS